MNSTNADIIPAAVEAQLALVTEGLQTILGANLAGAYLHGSLAHGGFELAHSDIDLLIVVHRTLAPQARRALAELLLQYSGAPCAVELSVITTADASHMRHPLPFELHFSESHRAAFADGSTQLDRRNEAGDHDLVAHVLATRRRGRVLAGAPLATWLPEPPRAAVADAFARDLQWARGLLDSAPRMTRYAALNAARAVAWAREDLVLSKREGALRGAEYLPPSLQALAERALHSPIANDETLAQLIELALEHLDAVLNTRRGA